MGYRDYSTAKGHIVDATGHGDFSTISAAITAASSGQTIFVRPGTYTENPTLKAGVNLTAFDCDALTPNVIINGKCTFTAAGTVSISGIQLQTNSDYALAVTGSAASLVNLTNCFLNCLNNTGINFTSSSSSAEIVMSYCFGNLGTTGIAYYTCSSAGTISVGFGSFNNTGASTTASSNSSGAVSLAWVVWSAPLSTSSTGTLGLSYALINTSATNTACVTTAGTGTTTADECSFSSGSASALSIGTGTSFLVYDVMRIDSTNTNAITGLGTIKYGSIVYTNTSSKNNTTTQTSYVKQPTLKAVAFNTTYNLATASGNQTVSGLGITPIAITDVSASLSGGTFYSICGVDDGISPYCNFISSGTANASGAAIVVGTSASAFQTATVSSFGAGQFVFAWVKNSTPTGTATISGMALGYQ